MKFLFLVVTSKTHMHGDAVKIDRVDLTRKLDAINTWVSDVIYKGHDVVFFDGGNETEWYDENTKTLHTIEDDGYEDKELSVLFPKCKAAIKWALKNKDFDILYLCDDDVYININQFEKLNFDTDYMGKGSYGGAGCIFNKKSLQTIVNYENTNARVCDQAIYEAISKDENITKNFNNVKSSIFYLPAELYATIHYVTGKRSYFLHNTFRYFNENGYTNRKILLGGPLDSNKQNEVISYETTHNRKTRRWYDFTIDPNGWEYHGGYTRAGIVFNHLKDFWPYAENSSKFFVINHNLILKDYIGHPIFFTHLNYLVEQCEKSLIDKKNILLCSETIENINGWILDNSVKEKYKLNFELLNEYNFYKKI